MTVGPLAGIRVVELAGMGPAPHAATLLGDLDADVVRICRPGAAAGPRGRTVVEADLKTPEGRGTAMDLVARADVLVEGFRPGVTERLGLGPADCAARNPRLVYARMTGWGQEGPLAARAGHDITYLAVTGVLDAIGREGAPPTVPLNLVGDFGGGSLYLVVGVLSGLLERERSGSGQVVDAAIVDGVSHLASALWTLHGTGRWTGPRGTNRLDSGAPFYDVYETADGGHMAVGALEPQFYALLLEGLGLDPANLPAQADPAGWPELRAAFDAAFASRTRAEWTAVFEDVDACVAPVVPLDEAADHPHLAARGTLTGTGGVVAPAPAPRFSRTVPGTPQAARTVEAGAALAAWAGGGQL